jgi:hypothetical protein
MTESAAHQRFRSRIEYLLQHMQIVDVAITILFRQTNSKYKQGGTILDALNITSTRYNRLNHPVNHNARIFNFSRSRNAEHAIISLYRHFSEYMRNILGEMYQNNPLQFAGKASGSLQYHEIIKLGSIDAINERMIDSVFRKLESERSTTKLLEKILDQTGVHLDPQQQEDALMYLEMRHLLVHNNGKCDQSFSTKYGSKMHVSDGDRMPLQARIVQAGVDAVAVMIKDIDTQLIVGGFASSR